MAKINFGKLTKLINYDTEIYNIAMPIRTVKDYHHKLMELFENTNMFNPDTFRVTDTKQLLGWEGDVYELINKEQNLLEFHKRYILPLSTETADLNNAQYIFIASLILLIYENTHFFERLYFDKSKSSPVKRLLPTIDEDTTEHLETHAYKMKKNMILIEEKFFIKEKIEVPKDTYWKKEFDDFIFLDEDFNLYTFDGILTKSYWDVITTKFEDIFYTSILKEYENKLEYFEHEQKLDYIIDVLSVLPHNTKLSFFNQYANLIDKMYDDAQISIEQVSPVEQFRISPHKKPRRLSAEETALYRQNQYVKEAYVGIFKSVLIETIDNIIQADSTNQKERSINELVSNITRMLLLK